MKLFRSTSILTPRFCRNISASGSGDISDHERWIAKPEVERFMIDCMTRMNTPKDRAMMLAQNLSEADARGHFSHGLNRLAVYVSDIENDLCDPNANPKVLKESVSTAWVDGCKSLGVVVGHFAMNLAIQKAKETGIGWVSAKGSNHFGICQWYTSMATKENLIGIASTNTSPHVVPSRAQAKTFGTNPIAVSFQLIVVCENQLICLLFCRLLPAVKRQAMDLSWTCQPLLWPLESWKFKQGKVRICPLQDGL